MDTVTERIIETVKDMKENARILKEAASVAHYYVAAAEWKTREEAFSKVLGQVEKILLEENDPKRVHS